MEAFTLRGKVAVVTGAAQGIGAAVARLLAEQGADLALCDRDPRGMAQVATAARSLGRRVVESVLDVRDADAVAAFVADAHAGLGRIDVLVNNAGGGFASPFVDLSRNGEATLLAENFTSATQMIRCCVPHMIDHGGGAIVNITSIEAHRAAPGYATYAAMKAALANLTASLALELGPSLIRVNCVAPDMIPTPGIVADPGQPLPVTTPLPIAGSALDVAHAVLFLATDASRFVTGTTIHVDGGNLAAGGWHRRPDGTFTT